MSSFREMNIKRAEILDSGIDYKTPEYEKAMLEISDLPVLGRDNFGYSYPICIEDTDKGKVLSLVGAPSGWLLGDIFAGELTSPEIYLDFGQNWKWINVIEVLVIEALKAMPVLWL